MKDLFALHRKSYFLITGFLVLLLGFGCQKEPLENEDLGSSSRLKSTEAGNLIIMTKSEILPADFEAKIAAYGEVVQSIPEIGQIIFRPTVPNVESKIGRLREVQAVFPDLSVQCIGPAESIGELTPSGIGDDESFIGYLWNMYAIQAPEAWDARYTGNDVRVFILDAGIDADNPDLAPNLNTALSKSFIEGEDYNVSSGRFFNHGTHVAGIIAAADNGWGVIGVAPNAELVAVKVLAEESGSGPFSGINAGIVYAANNGADIINMSLGAWLNKNGFYQDDSGTWQKVPASYIQNMILAQQRAIDYAYKMGVLVVSSAGNTGINSDGNGSMIKLPGELRNVVTVSATAPRCWVMETDPLFDYPASYTDYGVSLVDIAAPGGDAYCEGGEPFDLVLSCGAGDPPSYPFYFAAGTSMAAPHVSGVAALIIGKNGGEMDPQAVTKQLLKTADKIDKMGSSIFYGKGRVNAIRAVTE